MTNSHGGTDNKWAKDAAPGSPFHMPKIKRIQHKRWTTEKVNAAPNHKVSIFEAAKPNKSTRAVNSFDKTIGERPPIDLDRLFMYRDRTPQIDSIIEYLVDLVVGTNIVINTDEDDESENTAKALMTNWASNVSLYTKTRAIVDDTMTCGNGFYVKVIENQYLVNLEQFDVTSIERVQRDLFGNPQKLIVKGENLAEVPLEDKVFKQFVPLVFRPRGRDYFGRSIFHGLAIDRTVGNRTTRPIIEALWSLDDVVIGTLENYGYPIEYHMFDGISDEDLEKEMLKLKDARPGDRFGVSRMHEIDRREPTRADFSSYFKHLGDIVQLGTGFPLEILLGDFTSRASSQTTDSLLMRRIKSFQEQLTRVIKEDILEFLLANTPDSKWKTREAIDALKISVEFETQTPMEYTPDQVLARVQNSMWSKKEGREYDKQNGQNLFDDEQMEQEEEEQDLPTLDDDRNEILRNEAYALPFRNKYK